MNDIHDRTTFYWPQAFRQPTALTVRHLWNYPEAPPITRHSRPRGRCSGRRLWNCQKAQEESPTPVIRVPVAAGTSGMPRPTPQQRGAGRGSPDRAEQPLHQLGAGRGSPDRAEQPLHQLGDGRGSPDRAEQPLHQLGAGAGSPDRAEQPLHQLGDGGGGGLGERRAGVQSGGQTRLQRQPPQERHPRHRAQRLAAARRENVGALLEIRREHVRGLHSTSGHATAHQGTPAHITTSHGR